MSLTAGSCRRTRKHQNLPAVACQVLTRRRGGVIIPARSKWALAILENNAVEISALCLSDATESSGHRQLDNEVMSMIERAQPLPPFPASMPQAKLDLTVPIRFSLQ